MRTTYPVSFGKLRLVRQNYYWLGALLVLLTGSVVAQNQPFLPPNQSTLFPQSQPGFSGVPVVGRPIVPAFVAANAPELVGIIGDREQMEQYVTANPASANAAWLRNTLASNYRHTGRATPALNHWSTV